MILWKDFILDDVIGPSLAFADEGEVCRMLRFGGPGVMEDASGKKGVKTPIQETGQVRQPARMVGYSSLDSAQTGMEAGRGYRATLRRKGEV